MAAENIQNLDSASFEGAITNSDKPVLIDFWAPWCGPCKAIAPILDELAGELGDKVSIGKVNVDENQEIAGKYGIRAIPTLLIFQGGEIKEQIVGMTSKADLSAKLQALV